MAQGVVGHHALEQAVIGHLLKDAAAAKANAQAAEADYARLSTLEDYKTIRAPFAGTITARNTDIGQLIKADTDSDPELFDIADTHQLRLYVPVPQNYASVIRPGCWLARGRFWRTGLQHLVERLGRATAKTGMLFIPVRHC